MTREQTKQTIEVMQHYANGGEVECKTKYEKEWSRPCEPIWDWAHYDYRIKPEPVGIPATEEEQ